MKIKVVKDETKELRIEFQETDLTFPDMIANALLKVGDVEFAGVTKDHPETGKPLLVIKSKKSAKSDLAEALKSIEETATELAKQLPKK